MKGVARITCQRVSYNGETQNDLHSYAQLSLPLFGRKFNMVNGISIEHSKDLALYIPPNCRHDTYSRGKNAFLMFNIPSEYLPNWHDKIQYINYFDKKWFAVKQLVELEVGEEANDSAIITDMFAYILNMLCRDELPKSIKYIQSNYNRKITVKELAAIENYNTTYYCEWFLRKFGWTPLEYITSLRMEKAKRLLQDTDFTVLQIALQLGYESESSFAKRFLNFANVTPGHYRKMNRRNDK